MRLKDPFMGIKMAQGHIVTHASFFITMTFFLKIDPPVGNSTKAQLDAYEDLLIAFNIMKWGHLMMAICQLLGILMKKRGTKNCSQFLVCFATMFFYFFPLLNALFNFKRQSQTVGTKLISNADATHVQTWIFIELYYFFMWI